MKKTIEDHQLLRTIIKETINSDMELIDFGFQLDLHPSMVKQKLWDYPKSIETASYMVVSEWWDSLDNSREVKYKMLCDAVHSIGKKYTAQRLANLVLENGLSPQSQASATHMSQTTNCSQHLAANSSAFSESNASVHKTGPNLPISNNSSPIFHEGIRSISNIDDTSKGGEAVRSNRGNLGVNEISRADEKTSRGENISEHVIPARLTSKIEGSNDVFGASDVKASSANDTDIFETVGNSIPVEGAEVPGEAKDGVDRVDVLVGGSKQSGETDNGNAEASRGKGMAANFCGVGYSSDRVAHSQTREAEDIVFTEQNNVLEDEKECKKDSNNFEIETAHAKKIQLKAEGFSWLEANDVDRYPDVSPDSGLYETFGEPMCNSGFVLKSPFQMNLDDPDDVDLALPEVQIANEVPLQLLYTTRKENAEKATKCDNIKYNSNHSESKTISFGISKVSPKYRPTNQNLSCPVANGQASLVNDQTDVINAQTGVVIGHTGLLNGQRGVLNAQTGAVNAQTGVVNDQTGRVEGQTGVGNSQTCVENGLTGVINAQTGVVNGQAGIVNGLKGVLNAQRGVVNGQTGVTNDQTDVMNGQTDVMNGQIGVVNGQAGIENGQAGIVNGQKGVLNAQIGVVNGQTGVGNDQTDVMNDQTGVVNGQAAVMNGQRGVVNGQTGVTNGQTGVTNGQAAIMNGQTGVMNGQSGIVNGESGAMNTHRGIRNDQILEQIKDVHRNKPLGFLQRMLRFFLKKKTRNVNETCLELDSDDQPVWETVNIQDSYCLLEKYPSQ